MVDTIALANRENKLDGEISNIVREEKAWRKMPYWPAAFPVQRSVYADDSDDDGPKMPVSGSEDD